MELRRLQSEKEIDLHACVQGRTFCFVGDSHMRHAYNGVMSLLQGSVAWHSPLDTAASASKRTDKTVKKVAPACTALKPSIKKHKLLVYMYESTAKWTYLHIHLLHVQQGFGSMYIVQALLSSNLH